MPELTADTKVTLPLGKLLVMAQAAGFSMTVESVAGAFDDGSAAKAEIELGTIALEEDDGIPTVHVTARDVLDPAVLRAKLERAAALIAEIADEVHNLSLGCEQVRRELEGMVE